MSHEHTVIDLADGLTVLIGPNNCGKSAVINALQVLCHNDKSTYVRRHGSSECRIVVTTDDDHQVEWSRKRSGSPQYRIDGEKFDRLKGHLPAELHQVLRLPKVISDKDEFDVHFGEQKSPTFLLNDSSRAAAQFFASSSDARHLIEMQTLHKSKVRDARKTQARLTQEIARINQSLQAMEPLDDALAQLQQVESRYEQLRSKAQRIDQCVRLIHSMESTRNSMAHWQQRTSALSRLQSPPPQSDTRPLEELVRALQHNSELHENALARLVPLAQLESPPPNHAGGTDWKTL